MALWLSLVPGVASAANLVLEPVAPGEALVDSIPALDEYAVWRYREVTPDLTALYDAAAPAAPDPTVSLNLFDDAIFVASFIEMDVLTDVGLETWTGVVEGQMGLGTAVFVLDPANGRIFGGVRVDGDLFRLKFDDQEGRYLLAQLDPEARPDDIPECGGALAPPADEPMGAGVLDQGAMAPSADGGGEVQNVINLLIVLDRASAENYVGVWSAAYAIGEANAALAAQGNPTRYWGTRFKYADYTGSGYLGDDLDWLDGSSYAGTDRGAADLVMLMVDDGDYCGLGYLGDGTSRKNSVFTSVVVRSCAENNLSLPHELGHNLSACHDRYVEGNACIGGFVNYRHGYIVTWKPPAYTCPWYRPSAACNRQGVRSVMAYQNYCLDNGFTCPRVAVFSDPSQVWTVGPFPPNLNPLSLPFGNTSYSDVNAVIEFTAGFVKNYR